MGFLFPLPWNQAPFTFCKICKEETFAFQKLSDDDFFTSIVKNIDLRDDLNLRISPIPALKTLFNDLSGHNKDEPSPINWDYYDLSIPYHLQVTATFQYFI